MPVIVDARDLGAHLNTLQDRKRGTILSERMRLTAGEVKRFDYINAPYEKKEQVVRAKMVPKCLFGCETSPVNEAAMRNICTSIANSLTFTTNRRSTDFTFAVASGKNNLVPAVEIYVRRATLCRRVVGGSPGCAKMAKEVMQLYKARGEPGVHQPISNRSTGY